MQDLVTGTGGFVVIYININILIRIYVYPSMRIDM
jgi:hypothetical protein